MADTDTSIRQSFEVYRRLLGHTGPYRKGFVLAMVGMIIAAATEPLFPAMMKPLLDDGFVNTGQLPIWVVPVALIGIFVVRGIATFASNYALAWVANKVLVDLRHKMFAHMMRLSSEAFERDASGLIVSKIVFEVTNVTGAATRVLTVLVKDSLIVVGLLGWLFYLNWKLTLVALLLIPATALVISIYSRRMRVLARRNLEHTGELTRVVQEAVQGYKVVKIFGGYAQQSTLFDRTAERLRSFAMRMTVAGSATVPITQLCAAVAVSVVITVAMVQSANNQTTVGGFVSFITAMLMLLAPLKRLADINAELQRGLAAAEGVFALLDQPTEPDSGTRVLARARGAIRFENVTFRYPNADVDAVSGINLDIRPGEVVALVGASGAGKSSLIALLPRLVEPDAGRILLDEIPINEIRLDSLRDQLGVVSQDVVLFNDTVRGNVAFGRNELPDDELIWEALRGAALETHVRSLPGGLDHQVGEGGTRFSGGQRQRLAIARALLRNPPVLLLDEATSALDSRTERDVQQALERIMANRTTLVIAHRLSTIERADRIVVMDHGRIVEQGPHLELLARGGIYASLHSLQFAETASDDGSR
ncbi:MAG: lipid A export permease/ATP-binding protein MsbA [Burkholderiaceae bacterium]